MNGLKETRSPEAALHKYPYVKLFWKYAADLQENTHAEVRVQ